MRSRRSLALHPAAALVALSYGCGGPVSPSRPSLEARLQAAVAQAADRTPGGSAVLLVDIPSRLRFAGAAGIADPDSRRRAASGDRFRLASITKTMTAAVVLQLAEEARLDLKSNLTPYFPTELLDRLHVIRGSRSGRRITIVQLLSHTSGLADYMDIDANKDGQPDMVEWITADPERQWQPLELVELTIRETQPRFSPGISYSYSNTNYLLLGLVIEAVTGQRLHEAYRERLFSRLGMGDSYLQGIEAPPPGPPAAFVYYDKLAVPPWVSTPLWAAGGVVSSTADLAGFLRALFEGGVFRDPATLARMRDWSPQSGQSYGLGVEREFPPGAELHGHTGSWGSFMYYWPLRRTVIAGTINQDGGDSRELVREVVRAVNEEESR